MSEIKIINEILNIIWGEGSQPKPKAKKKSTKKSAK